jgi:hypothetical protein
MQDWASASIATATVARKRWVGKIPAMSRYEFFGALFAIGCINGLGSRIIGSIRSLGFIDASISTYGVSVIVWAACYQGLRLTIQETSGQILLVDLAFGGALLILIALPIGGFSWLAVTLLALYVLWTGSPSSAQRRGAIILLGSTVPMLWSPTLFRYFADFILEIDASLVGFLLRTGNNGNVVPFRDGSGSLMILPVCSSFANVSLAFLAWVTISNWLPRRSSLGDMYWCVLAAASVVAVNVTRISLMGMSQAHYNVIHSELGDAVVNLVLMGLIVGICLLGARGDQTVQV